MCVGGRNSCEMTAGIPGRSGIGHTHPVPHTTLLLLRDDMNAPISNINHRSSTVLPEV